MLNSQLELILNLLRFNPLITEDISITLMREAVDDFGDKPASLPSVNCEKLVIGGVDIFHFHSDRAPPEKVILYLHGGGYVIGSSRSHRSFLERLCLSFGGSVFSVDYRLAPEFPFPAALNDVLVVYKYLLRAQFRPNQIVLAGDSAGGGLALATLVNCREDKLPQPSCSILISPWTDLALTGESIEACATLDPIVKKETLIKFRSMYLAGALPTTPLASPLYANLKRLCPILIQVGGAEILLDDSLRLKSKLESVFVNVDLQVWDEMIHVWHLFAPILRNGMEAIEILTDYANSHVG